MENASKALIMAGGVLISILVISFMVFVLRKAGSMSAEYDNQMSDNERAKFNGQFEIYDKEDNTFFDVLTVMNLAYDINKRTNWDAQAGVTVKIINENNENVAYSVLPNENLKKDYLFKGTTEDSEYIYLATGESIIEKYTKRTDDNSANIYSFKCTKIEYNTITGKVKEMNFKIVKNN